MPLRSLLAGLILATFVLAPWAQYCPVQAMDFVCSGLECAAISDPAADSILGIQTSVFRPPAASDAPSSALPVQALALVSLDRTGMPAPPIRPQSPTITARFTQSVRLQI